MSFTPRDSSEDCSKATSSRSTSSGPAVRSAVRQPDELLGGEPGPRQHVGRRRSGRDGPLVVKLVDQKCEKSLIGIDQSAWYGGESGETEIGGVLGGRRRSGRRRSGRSPALLPGEWARHAASRRPA